MPSPSDRDWLIDSPPGGTAPAPAPARLSTPAEEWDRLRSAFASSIMVDTSLSSLAQNLDGLDWPLAGAGEVPATYIEFTYAELVDEFTRRGAPQAAALLCQILRDTLAFDEPFGEMLQQAEASAARDNPLLRSLQRLGLPGEFPLELTSLDDTAREVCRLEGACTLGAFTLLAQRLSQGVIVGGDLRRLLNAIAHGDEPVLAEFIPFRPGSTGLHLEEALLQAARSQHADERAAAAVAWFAAEVADWRAQAAADPTFLQRRFAAVADAGLQARAKALAAMHVRPVRTPTSWWSRLWQRFQS